MRKIALLMFAAWFGLGTLSYAVEGSLMPSTMPRPAGVSDPMTRTIKQGLIFVGRAAKPLVVTGKKILRAISPKLEDKVGIAYNKARQWAHKGETS